MYGNSIVGSELDLSKITDEICFPRLIVYSSRKDIRALVYPLRENITYQIWFDGKMIKHVNNFIEAVKFYNGVDK